jgi:hypothetical protein
MDEADSKASDINHLTEDEKWRAGYQAAFYDFINGQPLDEVKAKVLSGKIEPSKNKLTIEDTTKILTIVTSFFIGLAGLVFSGVQIYVGSGQKENEQRVAKAEAINKLITPLTSENPDARRYAISSLLTLQATEEKELRTFSDDIKDEYYDAELLDAVSKRLKDDSLKKSAAKLYVTRAKKIIEEVDIKLEDIGYKLLSVTKKEDSEKLNQLREQTESRKRFAFRDAERAEVLDPDNIDCQYLLGILLMDNEQYFKAKEKFEKVINSGKKERTSEESLRANLNLTICNKNLANRAQEMYAEQTEEKTPAEDLNLTKELKTKYEVDAKRYYCLTVIKYIEANLWENYLKFEYNDTDFHEAGKWLKIKAEDCAIAANSNPTDLWKNYLKSETTESKCHEAFKWLNIKTENCK